MKEDKDVHNMYVAARLNDHSNHSSATNGTSADLEGKDIDVEAQSTKPRIGDSTNSINPRDQTALVSDTSTETTIIQVNFQLERAGAVQLESLPGAYAVAPTHTPAEVDTSCDPIIQETPDSSNSVVQDEDSTATDFHNHDHGLTVANFVPEDTLQSTANLPKAQDFDAGELARKRARRAKRFQSKAISLGCLVLIGVTVILVVVVVLTRNNEATLPSDDLEANKLEPATEIPSPPPTTLHHNILALLPQDTAKSIEEDPESPQAQAFQWLLDDIEQEYLYSS
ncbi:expressed unknown protein [Seminavis robusta]|uniref:Uncharacterized protein n=1 Tax=Seminavis robusta TaxID=568900 RepID=A0A9N8HT45_9STRA|nr:expressed unknown protein [Seminavis robusta]|eukprot:Sro1610_g285840.1 n/a (283) ;mRNA; f:20294-21142